MNKLIKFLSFIYVFLIPFYDVPQTFKGGVALSGMVMIVIFTCIFLGDSSNGNQIIIPSKLIFSFFPLVIVFLASSLINSGSLYEKSLNHIILYI